MKRVLKFIVVCFSIVGLVSSCVFFVDFLDWAEDRISKAEVKRVSWGSIDEWGRAVEHATVKIVKDRETVVASDQTRYILLDSVRGLRTHKSLQGWQYAPCVAAAFLNGSIDVDINDWLLPVKRLDEGFQLYVFNRSGLLNDDLFKDKMSIYEKLVEEHTDKNSGLILYGTEDLLFSVDMLPFTCPALVRYGVMIGKKEIVDLAIRQIRAFHSYGYLKDHGLYVHSFRVDNKKPCESIGWGRGTGWWLMSLCLVYDELSEGKYRDEIYQLMLESAENIMALQCDDGGWCSQLVQQRYYDSSATAIFAWYLLKLAKYQHHRGSVQGGGGCLLAV